MEALTKQDLSLIKKTLLGPLIRWTEGDLTEEAVFLIRDIFLDLYTLFKERGFAAFWGEFLETRWPKTNLTTLEALVSLPDLTLYRDLQEIVEKAFLQKDCERICSFLEELKQSEVTDRLLGESIGIQIMTIHASKGLEFDVVFALGLASRTTNNEPLSEEEQKELDAEKMRQLYVALTRAKQKLYVPLVFDLDQKPVSLGEASPMEIFWDRVKPSLSDYNYTQLNEMTFSLKPYQPLKRALLCPPLALPERPPSEYILSFSALSQKTETYTPKTVSTLDIPLGTETGVILHRIFDRSLKEGADLTAIISEETTGTLLEAWEKQIQELVNKSLNLSLKGFSLNDIDRTRMQSEMEFLFTGDKGLMKGYIDLWFEKDGLYYILDWKTNYLEGYELVNLEEAMKAGDYFLQASIYAAALKKYLSRFDPRPFEECFGGVFYVFVRGPASFHFFPSPDL